MISKGDRVLLIVWKVLGLAPISYSVLPSGKVEGRFSLLTFLYGVSALMILIPLGTMALLNDLNGADYGKSLRMTTTTAVVVTFCDVLTPLAAAAAAVLGSALNSRLLLSAYAALDRVDSNLRLSHQDSEAPRLTALSFAALFLSLALDYFVWNNFNYDYVQYIPFYFFHIVTTGVELQFVSLVLKVRARFRILNERISRTLVDKGLKSYSVNLVMPVVETVSTVAGSVMDNVPEERRFSIQEISDVHWMLCGVVRDVNAAFGFQILCVFLSIFVHIIINPYFFVLALMSPGTYGTGTTMLLLLQVIWTALYISELFIIISPCSSTTEEANKTTSIICKHLNREMNPHMRKDLETFVIQLLHHDAEFSACGLFHLDLPRITSVAGAVTTYLVILIQFQNSDSS